MSVAKRNDGRWLVKFKDTAGCWKQRSFRSEEEARQFDADCQYDNVENSRLTLLEAVLVYLKNTELAGKTVGIYEYIVCGHDRKNGTHRNGPAEILADRFVDTLTRRDLETVRENCRTEGISPASTNIYVGKLKAALNWCAENDLLQENPWAKYRQLPGVKHKPRSGTLEEFQRLYPALPPWLQWASRTAIALCLRPGVSELFSSGKRYYIIIKECYTKPAPSIMVQRQRAPSYFSFCPHVPMAPKFHPPFASGHRGDFAFKACRLIGGGVPRPPPLCMDVLTL